MRKQVHDELVPLREAWPLWMTAATAARYLDFSNCKDPREAFRKFAAAAKLIPRGRRRSVPLYSRRDLDLAVTVVDRGGSCLL